MVLNLFSFYHKIKTILPLVFPISLKSITQLFISKTWESFLIPSLTSYIYKAKFIESLSCSRLCSTLWISHGCFSHSSARSLTTSNIKNKIRQHIRRWQVPRRTLRQKGCKDCQCRDIQSQRTWSMRDLMRFICAKVERFEGVNHERKMVTSWRKLFQAEGTEELITWL